MSRRDRRDSDRRDNERRDGDRRPGDRRDMQPDDDQQRRTNEPDPQESDSLTALKAILGKVANLLQPLQLTQDESIRLVEQLYGSVLDMDVKLAGEADDRRKSSVLAHIQNTTVARKGDKIVVEYPAPDAAKAGTPAGPPAEAHTTAPAAVAPEAGAAETRPAATGEVATPSGEATAAATESAPASTAESKPGRTGEGRPARTAPRPRATRVTPVTPAGEDQPEVAPAED